MATPTIAGRGQVIEMTFSDATTDFVWGTSAGSTSEEKLCVSSILFEPSGADTMVVREGSVTGPAIFRVSCIDGDDQKEIYFGKKIARPCVEGDDITLTTPASAKLIFNIA